MMAPVSKAQQKSVNRYIGRNYDRVNLLIPKGHKATLQAAAEQEGESINAYVNKAVLARLGLREWPEGVADE